MVSHSYRIIIVRYRYNRILQLDNLKCSLGCVSHAVRYMLLICLQSFNKNNYTYAISFFFIILRRALYWMKSYVIITQPSSESFKRRNIFCYSLLMKLINQFTILFIKFVMCSVIVVVHPIAICGDRACAR